MKLYLLMLKNSFKTNVSYRFDYILQTLFSFLQILISIYIWKALYLANGNTELAGVTLNEMISYSILTSLVNGIVGMNLMYELNNMVQNGEIGTRLLLPLGFRRHLFFTTLSSNLFWVIYSSLPPFLIAVLVYGLSFEFSGAQFILFAISLFFAFLINFFYSFLLGLSVLWLRNSFFLNWFNGALTQLFSGAFVPLWFFPGWLNTVSLLLPFRYMRFEPLAILLGKTAPANTANVLLAQILWILLLAALDELVWRIGRKRIMVQGG